MPLSEQSIATEITKLNDFLQASLSYQKDNSLPDINLNRLDLNDIRSKLDDGLKEDIIEFLYINQEGDLIKNSNNNVSVIQKAPVLPINLQPLVIIRNNADVAQGHLYRYKRLGNNQITLQYLGKKELPRLLITTQSLSDLANDEQYYEEDIANNNVNIIRAPKPIMTLSFAENGTCYLVIDSKKQTIVATDTSDSQHFKKFVANNCPRNGSLNIEVDESGKVICAYTINNETAKKDYIKINQDLIEKIEKIIAAAHSLQMNINASTSSKSPVAENNSFPAKEVNASAAAATTPPVNANQNSSIPTASNI